MISSQDLLFDKKHIWHPYTGLSNPLQVYPVKSAKGVRITLENGKELIDGMSSWWAAIHGYAHPVLDAALHTQVEKMTHVMFGGLTHEPAIRLAELLIRIVPDELQHIFFSDSGSVSVEVAIKMAFQYWKSKGLPGKNRLLTVRSAYHGDTFYAMSVSDPETGMHSHYTDILPVHFIADFPSPDFYGSFGNEDISSFEQLIAEHYGCIAAVILEPIVQGAGGMRFYSPGYLTRVRALCDHYQVLLILDEIATGFGRTGKLFACQHARIAPDIMCLGKALTGGYLTLAATLCTTEVAEVISSNPPGVLMHGPTFMANPLACAVSYASVNLLLRSDWESDIVRISEMMSGELENCRKMPGVADVRILGAIGVVEFADQLDVGLVQSWLTDQGVWLRPFGKLLYLMPPYIISEDDLSFLLKAVVNTVEKISSHVC